MVPTTRRHLSTLFLLLLLLFTACNTDTQAPPLPTAVLPATVPVVLVQDADDPAEVAAEVTPLPTRPATAVPPPTPTLDPAKDAWTIMVYMSADNLLEPFALDALNQMEAAGKKNGVNLLVQLDRGDGGSVADGDWTEARRYLVKADGDGNQIGSELLGSLGEINMGDPAQLSDFLSWGIQTFPANRYGLIIWGPGDGWHGAAFDRSVGFPGETDLITSADLAQALSDSLKEAAVDRLDLIGFDGGAMSHMEVMQAVAPYADTMTAAASMTGGQGWDYQRMLSWLYQDPNQEGIDLSAQIAASFGSNREPVSEPTAAISAVALDRLPDISYALQQLVNALEANLDLTSGAVSDARAAAAIPPFGTADPNDRGDSIDLKQFADTLARRTPDEGVRAWAGELSRAVDAALMTASPDGGAAAGGIQIYFPWTAADYLPAYAQTVQIPGWDRFLNSYYQATAAGIEQPVINITQVLSQSVGLQNPAFLDFEISGRNIERVQVMAGQYQEDGRLKLLWIDRTTPDQSLSPDGSQLPVWRDGIHESFFVWDSSVSYLYDSDGAGDYAAGWPVAMDSSLVAVAGGYRPAGSEIMMDAVLTFERRSGRMSAMWVTQDHITAEAVPQAGDEFRLSSLMQDAQGRIETIPGQSLFFDADGALSIDWRPLPDGDYVMGAAAEDTAGGVSYAFTDLAVLNSGTQEGYTAYFDPYLGFQFLYPALWDVPSYQDSMLTITNEDGTTQLQITLFTDVGRDANAANLAQEAVQQFGPVQLLYTPETIAIGGRQGQRTAYGYENADDQQRTGIFVSFVREDVGYLIDVDGPVSGESDTIAVVDTVVDSWQFRPASFGLVPGNWAAIDLADFTIAQPSDFSYQPVNDWHRFSKDLDTFAAIRIQPLNRTVDQALEALIRDAGPGVEALQVGDPFPYYLDGSLWSRADFSYRDGEAQEIRGFLMAADLEGKEVVAWVEASADSYDELESKVFLMMIADMELSQ